MARTAVQNERLTYNYSMKVAVTYNRFSPGPNQREESITGQLRENHRLAEQKGLTVIHDYIDRSITGRSDDRPEFQRMLKDAESGLFQWVICYQTGRFARDRFDAIVYKRKLKKLGVKVLYSKMNIPDGPEGIILESVLEGLDEYYSEELRQKVVRGQYDNAIQGKASGGPIPYGLKLSDDKYYIIDEDKSVIVREIFNRYAAGEMITDIIWDLNRRGLRTAKGGEFNKNSIHRMLKNPKYYGLLVFNSTDENYDEVRKENAIPAIITKELFLKVQKRIGENKHRTSKMAIKPLPVKFLLSGKAFDGTCGGALVGDSGTSKTGQTYYYYTCTNKKLKKTCKTKSIKKDLLEDIIVGVTKEKILVPETINFISDCIIQLQEKNLDMSMLNSMESELKQVQASLKNIMNAIERGIITDSTKSRLVELEGRQAKLEAQISIEKRRLKAPKVLSDKIIYFLEKFKDGNANDEMYRKTLIDLFVHGVIVNPETITIAYNYCGENDIIDVDLETLKNSSDSVRMSLLNWSLRNNIRTLQTGTTIEFDIKHHLILFQFKRAA